MEKTHKHDEPASPEYDFQGGVRGKYIDRFGGGRNVVVLEPDVAAVFPNSDAVNQALRGLIGEHQQGPADKKP